MLTGMLLHVVSSTFRIDLPANAFAGGLSCQYVNDVSRRLFIAVYKRNPAEDPYIVRLTSRSRIERRSIENDTHTVTHIQASLDFGLELKKIRFVVVEPFGWHKKSLQGAEYNT